MPNAEIGDALTSRGLPSAVSRYRLAGPGVQRERLFALCGCERSVRGIRHAEASSRCPLSEAKRTWLRKRVMSAPDPKRTFTGPKSRSAAVSRRIACAIVWAAAQEGSAAPHLDSEQFRSAPRT